MPEDYLSKSGAKDVLASAIAGVLTLKPRVPVAFLASHFQGLATNKSVATVSCLRACHPNSTLFPSAVEKVFFDLASMEMNPNSYENLPPRSNSAGTDAARKVKVGGPAIISKKSFLQLLQQLSQDFPKSFQTRIVESALSVPTKINTKETSSSQGVGLARFHRGVKVCLLVEDLFDAAMLLFQALKPTNSDSVASDALMNTLRSTATTQFSQELSTVLTSLLCVPQHALTASELSNAEIQLSNIYDMLLDLVFVS